MKLEACTLSLKSFNAEDDLQSDIPIDLTIANMMRNEDALPYEIIEIADPKDAFDPNPQTSTAGVIRFSMPNNQPILGRIRDRNSDTVPGPMTDRQFYEPSYVMWHDPTEQNLSTLASAILTYQQQVYQPLG